MDVNSRSKALLHQDVINLVVVLPTWAVPCPSSGCFFSRSGGSVNNVAKSRFKTLLRVYMIDLSDPCYDGAKIKILGQDQLVIGSKISWYSLAKFH